MKQYQKSMVIDACRFMVMPVPPPCLTGKRTVVCFPDGVVRQCQYVLGPDVNVGCHSFRYGAITASHVGDQ